MKRILLFSLIFFINFEITSQISYVSQTDGSWGTSTTWNPNGIPTKNDFVTIEHNITGYAGSNYSECATLTISTDGVLDLNNSAYSVRIWQTGTSITNNGTITNGYIYPMVNITISGTGTFSNVGLNKQGGTLHIGCNINFEKRIQLYSGADLYLNSGKTMIMNAPYRSNGSLLGITNNGTIILNDLDFDDAFISINGDFIVNVSGVLPNPRDGFKNLTLNSANTFETGGLKYGGGDVRIDGDFTISSNNTFLNDINLKGNLILDNSELTMNSNIIKFNGTSLQSITESGTGIANLSKIELDNSAGLNLTSGTINISDVMQSINGEFTQNGATITLKSSSDNNAGMIKVSSSSDYSYSSGVFTTERYFNATSSGWRMVGAPIQNSTLNDWDDEFDYCGFTGSDYSYLGCGNFCSVWFYDETSAQVGNSGAGFDSATNITNSTTPDNGSIIYTSQGTTTLSVTGTPEFRDRSFVVTKSGADAAFGYNLLSNPYPCTLDWTTFRADNTFLDNGYYIYQADAGNYLSVSGSGTIPHSQGFFVKKTSNIPVTSTLNFSTSQTVNTQANFTKSVNGINLPLTLKLTSNNNPYYDFAYVNTGTNYSNNYDPGEDIFELFSPYPDYVPNLFFLDNQGNQLDRTSINNNNSIDLLFEAKIGPFAHGTYTINFENLSQFMIGSCLTLEDLHNGIQTDLRLDSSYTFLSDSNSTNPRFKLHIDVDYDIIVSNLTCFQDSSANISLKGNSIIGNFFNLIDSVGNLSDSVTATQDSLSFTNLNAGTYNILTNHIGRCNLQVQDIIIVEPQEVIANFQNINDTIFLDSSGSANIDFNNASNGANYYTWNFGDGSISNLNSPTHSYNASGVYIVSLEARSDSTGTCSSTYSKLINVINPFSTVDNNIEISKDFNFSVSDKYIELNFENNFENEVGLQMFSIDNKLVYSKYNLNPFNKINLSNLNIGIYIITLSNQRTLETLYLKKFFLN
ncbi:MAG: hypothetical protein CL832_00220 [Crocinitomicaceae bacterium]|nr:hypothetical protein [Crocinitomicaceae bacterium]